MKSVLFLFPLIIVSAYAKDWWINANFYQIYPRSFKDSDGDGIGDLNGVAEKLEYLKSLGMAGVWLSPIFKSPMADFGYDISDYRRIHPEYGTLEDFENLIAKAKKIGLKIILDFVPNHTSDEHEWFKKSVAKEGIYTDFYIWRDAKIDEDGNRQPPNNWLSAFRYSAWEWNDVREQYYLHQFAIKQPDLNYRSEAVVEEMKDTLRFWMTKGVSGFRIDAVPFMFETQEMQDEPINEDCPDPDSYCHLQHIYTNDQPETYEMIYDWHDILTQFAKDNGGGTRIMLTEAYTSLDNIIRFYGDGNRNGSNVPFNFELLSKTNRNSNANDFADVIDTWLNKVPAGSYANWVLGNHDNKRLASRFGKNRADLMNILLQTLPGIAVTYNGEEIAMTDVFIDWEDTVDPQACNTNPQVFDDFSRDPARTPFQWDGSTSAGFSSDSETWLPVSQDYKSNNVAIQQRAPVSHLNIFKKLTKLRQEPSLQEGTYQRNTVGNDLLVYKREARGSDIYVILLNFGNITVNVDLTTLYPGIHSSVEIITTSVHSGYSDGDVVSSKKVIAYPEAGTVFVSV